MLTVKVDSITEKRIAFLSQKTGKPESYYTRKMKRLIHEYIEDMEDYQIAMEVLSRNEPTYTMAEVKKELGLEY